MTGLTIDERIRSLRPQKKYVDPFEAHGSLIETERRPDGTIESALTVFLAGAECPFTCSFCDLWKFSIDGPTPSGALTTQLEGAIAGIRADRLKLYNASNFFDTRSVPLEDLRGIARLGSSFDALTVESHANTIGPRVVEFAGAVSGRLELAVGLETIHPDAASKLNKRLDLVRFDRAANFLRENGIDLRVFVLLGVPHVPSSESVEWTVRTVQYAVTHGASVVSVIPVRGGNGEMERLEKLGEFVPPTLSQLEDALDRCRDLPDSVVTADLWDIERLSACDACSAERIARLQRQNHTGIVEPRITCSKCVA